MFINYQEREGKKPSALPVSYTHLDVYKRQIKPSFQIPYEPKAKNTCNSWFESR